MPMTPPTWKPTFAENTHEEIKKALRVGEIRNGYGSGTKPYATVLLKIIPRKYYLVMRQGVAAKCNQGTDMEKPTKQLCLEHYGQKEPQRFIQVDVHDIGVDGDDDILQPDEYGFSITGRETWELMNGPHDGLRVFINPEMPMERIRTALSDLLECVEWIDKIRNGFVSRSKDGMRGAPPAGPAA